MTRIFTPKIWTSKTPTGVIPPKTAMPWPISNELTIIFTHAKWKKLYLLKIVRNFSLNLWFKFFGGEDAENNGWNLANVTKLKWFVKSLCQHLFPFNPFPELPGPKTTGEKQYGFRDFLFRDIFSFLEIHPFCVDLLGMVNVGDLLPRWVFIHSEGFLVQSLGTFWGVQCGSSARGFSMEVGNVDGFEVNRITWYQQKPPTNMHVFSSPSKCPWKNPQGFNSKTNPPATFFPPKNLMAFVTKL